MLKKYQRYRWYIACGVSIAFLFLVLFGFVMPSLISVKEKTDEMRVIENKNEVFRKKINALDSFTLPDLEDKYRLANIALLPAKDPFKIVALFDNVLSEVDPKNVSMGTFRFRAGDIKNKKDPRVSDLLFEQDMAGEPVNLNKFIDLIEKGYPFVTVKAIEGQFLSSTPIGFTFILHIYPEIDQIPSIETPVDEFSNEDNLVFEEIKPYALKLQERDPSDVKKSGRINPFSF